MTDVRDSENDMILLLALRAFVAEQEGNVLSRSGSYMRYGDGQPICVFVALAKDAIQRLEKAPA